MLVFTAPAALADCASPAAPAGSVVYNEDENVPQVCADNTWVALGALNPGAGGGSCSNPSGSEGSIVYNVDHKVLQYCDGENWMAIQAAYETGGGGGASKTVFVTSTTYLGDLGGLSGADNKCQTSANDAGLSGTYKAWIADTTVSNDPESTFTQSTDPYKLIDGTTIADNWTDLVDGTLAAAINVDENGNTVISGNVWTGVLADGTREEENFPSNICDTWTRDTFGSNSHVGDLTQTGSTWTDGGGVGCDTPQRLYCFEQ